MVTILFVAGFFHQAVVDERPVFTRFEVSREKDEHKISVSAVLKNPGPADLKDVWVSVAYFDGDRELRSSKPTRVARLPAREATPVTLEARQVEKFSRYEVLVQTDDRSLVYAGTLRGDAEDQARSPRQGPSSGSLSESADPGPQMVRSGSPGGET